MDTPALICTALTKSGAPCKNRAVPGSVYCRVHTSTGVEVGKPIPSVSRAHQFVQELEDLVQELRQVIPEYDPPEFSRQALARMLMQDIDSFSPQVQMQVLKMARGQSADVGGPQVARMLEDYWYLINLRMDRRARRFSSLAGRVLDKLPGGSLVKELAAGLEGSSPEDFLDPDTWRGLWMVLNYSMQSQVQNFRNKILGEDNE